MNLMLSGDWVVFAVFIFGGALGKWIATTNAKIILRSASMWFIQRLKK